MKNNICLIILILSTQLYATGAETIHSSVSLYYELKNFSNSVQKENGTLYGIYADTHYKKSELIFAYEEGDTKTIKPPLTEDLKSKKVFLKYGYNLTNKLFLHVNYINILNDNIAPTKSSESYSLGVSYALSKEIETFFQQYYTDYQIFDAYQSDLKVNYKLKLNDLKFKFSLIEKYIHLEGKNNTLFSRNAKNNYSTVGFKVHSHYNSYHMGAGAYFGKRAFAIMNDGFKIQNHAMEFDRTYACAIGKTISNITVKYQYIYQRSIELPISTRQIDITNSRITLNYKY